MDLGSVFYRSPAAGTPYRIPYARLVPVTGPDADGDGLPDIAEAVVGTNPHLTDPDGDVITITATTPPAHGVITPNGSGNGFIYTPNNGYVGFDTFTYQICDPEGLCDIATVTIEIISDCPTGPPVFVCAEPMIPSIICPEFCNIDPEDGITIISVTATFNCGVNLLDDGCIQYTPLPG